MQYIAGAAVSRHFSFSTRRLRDYLELVLDLNFHLSY